MNIPHVEFAVSGSETPCARFGATRRGTGLTVTTSSGRVEIV